jgi:hypothetical protein
MLRALPLCILRAFEESAWKKSLPIDGSTDHCKGLSVGIDSGVFAQHRNEAFPGRCGKRRVFSTSVATATPSTKGKHPRLTCPPLEQVVLCVWLMVLETWGCIAARLDVHFRVK